MSLSWGYSLLLLEQFSKGGLKILFFKGLLRIGRKSLTSFGKDEA